MRKRILAVAGLTASSAVALVALMTSTASAALPPPGSLGTLAVQPATGTAATAPVVVTSQGCTPDSDSYIAHVFGPGGFAPGLVATFGLQDVNFSSTQSFPVQFTKSMADIAQDNQTTVTAGTYVVQVSCMVAFSQTATGTFTTNLYFTDPAHYQVNDPAGPPSSSSTTTSPTVSTSQPTSTTSPTTGTTTTSATSTTSTSDTSTSSSSPTTTGTTGSTDVIPVDDSLGGGGGGAEQVVGTTVGTNLANTGVDAGVLALIGAALVGFGAFALLTTRRRKPAAPRSWPSE